MRWGTFLTTVDLATWPVELTISWTAILASSWLILIIMTMTNSQAQYSITVNKMYFKHLMNVSNMRCHLFNYSNFIFTEESINFRSHQIFKKIHGRCHFGNRTVPRRLALYVNVQQQKQRQIPCMVKYKPLRAFFIRGNCEKLKTMKRRQKTRRRRD